MSDMIALCCKDTVKGADILTFDPLTIGQIKRAPELISVVCPK